MPAMPAKAAAINRSFLLMFRPPLVLILRPFLFWYPSTGFSIRSLSLCRHNVPLQIRWCNRGRPNQRISVGRQVQGAWDNGQSAWDNGQSAYVVEPIAEEDAPLFVVVEMPERRNQHERLEASGYSGKVHLRQARRAGNNPVQNERGVERQRQHRLSLDSR